MGSGTIIALEEWPRETFESELCACAQKIKNFKWHRAAFEPISNIVGDAPMMWA